MVKQNVKSLALLAIVLDNNAAAANNLACGALLVDLAETGPLSELELRLDADEVDAVVRAQGLDELLVVLLVAVLRQNAQVCLSQT